MKDSNRQRTGKSIQGIVELLTAENCGDWRIAQTAIHQNNSAAAIAFDFREHLTQRRVLEDDLITASRFGDRQLSLHQWAWPVASETQLPTLLDRHARERAADRYRPLARHHGDEVIHIFEIETRGMRVQTDHDT